MWKLYFVLTNRVVVGLRNYFIKSNSVSATRRYYHRTLIDDVNKVPKNYTIIYKYLGAIYKEVAYLEIDVNVSVSLLKYL